MRLASRCPVFFLLIVSPCCVSALPLSYKSTNAAKRYVRLIVISTSLFFLFLVFLAIKLVYMKLRRIGTIHAAPGTVRSDSIPTGGCSASSFRLHNWHRGLLVGCLGSPTWETNLRSRLDRPRWRHGHGQKSSFGYQLHTGSTSAPARSKSPPRHCSSSSRLTRSTDLTSCSIDANQGVPPSSSGPLRIPRGGSSSKVLCSVQRDSMTDFHLRYGDLGESRGVKSPGGCVSNAARPASPSSIRLVDGPSHGSQVEYSFLSGLPNNTIVLSPLMGTRDSFQLSKCSLKCDRKPVPPMPRLPLFLPFCLPKGPETIESRSLQVGEYIPPLHFSPLASGAKVFYPQQQVVEKAPGSDVYAAGLDSASVSSKTRDRSHTGLLAGSGCVVHTGETKVALDYKRSRPRKGGTTLAPIEDERGGETGSTPGVVRTTSGPVKSCLRRNPVVPTLLACSPDSVLTPSLSMSTRTAGDSLQIPISDVDIRVLGLDRFRWNEEPKVQSCHAKKDSIALVPSWE